MRSTIFTFGCLWTRFRSFDDTFSAPLRTEAAMLVRPVADLARSFRVRLPLSDPATPLLAFSPVRSAPRSKLSPLGSVTDRSFRRLPPLLRLAPAFSVGDFPARPRSDADPLGWGPIDGGFEFGQPFTVGVMFTVDVAPLC